MDITRRSELQPLERAVSDTLDEWVSRTHGILSSWSYPFAFITWLEKRGYKIVKIDTDPPADPDVQHGG